MRVFGDIPGYHEGIFFASRLEASHAGVHRPTQAGISGSAKEGADSIVVSGGYEDDHDLGTEIIYVGHGGRDPETGEQVADQELTPGNLALMYSSQHDLPVRVIRGVNSHSQFAPKSGYRYDGLYRVEEYWHQIGKSGHMIWCFRLKKINPETAPWKVAPPAHLTAKTVKSANVHKTPANQKPYPTSEASISALKQKIASSRQVEPQNVPITPQFKVGDVVRHPVFGDGVVSLAEPSTQGDQIVLVVFSSSVGSKKFLASKANLQRLS